MRVGRPPRCRSRRLLTRSCQDEFRVALYTCDPSSGNTVGFQPSKLLTPKDAFAVSAAAWQFPERPLTRSARAPADV